jgi:hypothetical protein
MNRPVAAALSPRFRDGTPVASGEGFLPLGHGPDDPERELDGGVYACVVGALGALVVEAGDPAAYRPQRLPSKCQAAARPARRPSAESPSRSKFIS